MKSVEVLSKQVKLWKSEPAVVEEYKGREQWYSMVSMLVEIPTDEILNVRFVTMHSRNAVEKVSR